MKKIFLTILLGFIFFSLIACKSNQFKPTQQGNIIDSDIDLKGKQADDDPNTIECYIYSAGFGVEWFNACAKKFMELYPEYKIVAQESSSSDTLRKKLSTGPKLFTTDLIITGDNLNGLLALGSKVYSGYPIMMFILMFLYLQTLKQ